MLGLWLVLYGVFALVPSLRFAQEETLLALLAIAAGVMIVLER